MTTDNARFNRMQPGRIIIPGKKEYDVKIAITFNTITKETELHVEKGVMNQYGIMTLCLQHAAMLNANINMQVAPQGNQMQENAGGEPNGTA
jgi:hypothetical protein